MKIIKKEELLLSEEERQVFANAHSICTEICHNSSTNTELYNAAVEIMKNIESLYQVMQPTANDKTCMDKYKAFKEKLKAINDCEPLQIYRREKCEKCVWSNCFPHLDAQGVPYCATHEYKRDPPDGGYYG